MSDYQYVSVHDFGNEEDESEEEEQPPSVEDPELKQFLGDLQFFPVEDLELVREICSAKGRKFTISKLEMKVRKRADELQITKPTNAIAPLFANDRTHTKNILEALIYKHQVFTLQCRTVASFLYFHPHHIDPYMSCRNSSETKKWRSDLWKTHKKDAKMLDFFLKAGRGKAEPDHDMWNTDVYEQYEKIAWDEAPNLEFANYKSSDDDTL